MGQKNLDICRQFQSVAENFAFLSFFDTGKTADCTSTQAFRSAVQIDILTDVSGIHHSIMTRSGFLQIRCDHDIAGSLKNAGIRTQIFICDLLCLMCFGTIGKRTFFSQKINQNFF